MQCFAPVSSSWLNTGYATLELEHEHEQRYLPLATASAALAKLGMVAATFAYYPCHRALHSVPPVHLESLLSILYRLRAELNPYALLATSIRSQIAQLATSHICVASSPPLSSSLTAALL